MTRTKIIIEKAAERDAKISFPYLHLEEKTQRTICKNAFIRGAKWAFEQQKVKIK